MFVVLSPNYYSRGSNMSVCWIQRILNKLAKTVPNEAQSSILSILWTWMLDFIYHITFKTDDFVYISSFAMLDTMFTKGSQRIELIRIEVTLSQYNN